MKGENYRIALTQNARPFAVAAPRRVSAPLLSKVKEELDRLHSEGIIEPVVEPTDWCAPIVVVPRKTGDRVRLCVDYTELNKSIQRERWQLPTVEESLSKLEGGQIFSLLDATNGFLQVPLHHESYKLTTFITPFGRFFFKRLPFGINSGPEVYQKRIYQVLDGLDGVVNQADDILVVGRTQEEHDHRLANVLQRLREHNVTLNKDKCNINVNRVKFLGHLIENGLIKPDPEKVEAIMKMQTPNNVNELRQFLGMVNYLMKFIPNLAEVTAPLRILLKKGYQWVWSDVQKSAWDKIKSLISSNPVLVSYNKNRKTRVAADASSFGLGGVIEQFVDGKWKPITYASRSLSPTEMRYAQIEKEALALTWACERFSQYVLGTEFELMTDHKPLVQVLGSKQIASLSARLQRLRMRMGCFRYKVTYVKGKEFYVPDVLSRNPIKSNEEHEDILEQDLFVQSILDAIPCSDKRLKEIKEAQDTDEECGRIKSWIVNNNWNKNSVYWKYRTDLNISKGFLLLGTRLFIPKSLRKEILSKIHEGHMGIVKCRRRVYESVWWPGCSTDIATLVTNCPVCLEQRSNKSEPLLLTELPKNPWESLGIDLLKCNAKWYLVVQDYYSRFLELVYVDALTTGAVVARLKNIFARHGVPYVVRADGGPQFTSQDFKNFAEEYGFRIVTSSPRNPQSNGEAEKAVDIAKRILTKCSDPNLGLLEYRNTPLESGLSPAELLYSRKLRSTLPSINNFRQVTRERLQKFKEKDFSIKERNKRNYDVRKGVRDLSQLDQNDKVWIPDLKRYGHVENKSNHPRSYLINTQAGKIRRNRRHIIAVHRPIENGGNRFEHQYQEDQGTETDAGHNYNSNENDRPKRSVKPPLRYSDSDFYK
ncbi:uncharacterized protein K02A2.6-like [Macrosteles quadrilineatus]|uniref:uncharacterized protein K02A2.6-like n=1 Tax=Macrosteles quadrilineatus TaxID=74068 RepID=UPI0023E0EF11|nr:uncharacterized protein K02A2.6-like [Macrosteles quadrilineatus]